ncbi:hypothetical protein GC358_08405, partial [Yersinia pestis]|nr:hypothetical protein [Yersinia pestis]
RAKDGAARAYMDVFTASLRSACSLRRGHFVNNLRAVLTALYLYYRLAQVLLQAAMTLFIFLTRTTWARIITPHFTLKAVSNFYLFF